MKDDIHLTKEHYPSSLIPIPFNSISVNTHRNAANIKGADGQEQGDESRLAYRIEIREQADLRGALHGEGHERLHVQTGLHH